MKLITFAALTFFATGCATAVMPDDTTSSTPADAGSKAPAKDGGAVQKDAGSNAQPDSSTSGDDAATTPVDCSQSSTKSSCQQCCVSEHKPGYAVYTKTLTACACQSPGACVSECGTEYCAQKPTSPNDACETCLNAALTPNSGACYDPIATACTGDSDCMDLFQTCIPQCASLP